MDVEINALCIRFLNVLFLGCCFFFLQRKHTHNVASQYLLPCHDVSFAELQGAPSSRETRGMKDLKKKWKKRGRKLDDTKKDMK